MSEIPIFELDRLKIAVIEFTDKGKTWNQRSLSLAATNGKNKDLVRDFISRGQDRKPSFEAVIGLVYALGFVLSDFLTFESATNESEHFKGVDTSETTADGERTVLTNSQLTNRIRELEIENEQLKLKWANSMLDNDRLKIIQVK